MTRTDARHWDRLRNDLGARGEGRPTYEDLATAYSQSNRHYHNLRHIGECLLEADGARALAVWPAELEAAIWFHDAVYHPRSSTNEEDSANLAARCLTEARVDPVRVEHVRQLVLVTQTHEPGDIPDAALLIDIDLAILGQPPTRFWEYEHAIRAEYAWVPDATFARKRAEVLNRFLERPFLYHTSLFRNRYEAAARTNLAAAIVRLNATLE